MLHTNVNRKIILSIPIVILLVCGVLGVSSVARALTVEPGDSDTELTLRFSDFFGAFETNAYEVEFRRKTPQENWKRGCTTISNRGSGAGTGTATIIIFDLAPGTTYQVRYRDTNQPICTNNPPNPDPWSAIGEGTTSIQTPEVLVVDPASPPIYWTDAGTDKIQRANLDGSNVQALVTSGLTTPVGIALDIAGGKMYWTDSVAEKIQRANLDGSNVEDLITRGLDTPLGIALDVVSGKMYWTDFGTDKIQRANLDGSNVENLVTQRLLDGPRSIALDVASGKMYWIDLQKNKIQRANLDGSNVEDLVTLTRGLDTPLGIALDVVSGKMYWTDRGNREDIGTGKIQRANLDGSNVEDLVTQGLDDPDGIALDVANSKMYWTDWGTDKIQRANLDGSNVEDCVIGLHHPSHIALGIPYQVIPGTGQAEIVPVSDRTPQVRDAIVAAVPGVNSAADVTEAHLAAITQLWLWRKSISSLKKGDFDGLTNLEDLRLNDNQLNSLPPGIFSGLSSLRTLFLNNNQLNSLQADMFSGMPELSFLDLSNNQLHSLPEDIFSGLSSLSRLEVHDNQLRNLPEDMFSGLSSLSSLWLYNNQLSSLPAGIFSESPSLEMLGLWNNQLSSLPVGIFSGLSELEMLRLQGNSNLLPLTVSLEKVADVQFKAVVPTGAPFDIVLRIRVSNGNIDGDAYGRSTTITIPTGSVESEPLTISRTPEATWAVTVDIDDLPGLPTTQETDGRWHQGYKLVKSDDLPLAFTELGGSIRMSVRRGNQKDGKVLHFNTPIGSGNSVHIYNQGDDAQIHLYQNLFSSLQSEGPLHITITNQGERAQIHLNQNLFSSLQSEGPLHITITNQGERAQIHLNQNLFSSLQSEGPLHITITNQGERAQIHLNQNLFSGIQSQVPLYFRVTNQGDNAQIPLPNGLFSGTQLHNIRIVNQGEGMPITFSGAVFSGLQSLTEFFLGDNRLTSLPAGMFSGLSALTTLRLHLDHLTSLPEGVFSGLSALTTLGLHLDHLTSLPEGVFSGLSALTTLNLRFGRRTSLPEGVFSGLSALTTLELRHHLTSLPAGVFSGLSSLTSLKLTYDPVNPIPLIVSLEKVADGQFKAVAPTGAPFDIVLPVSVTNGTISGGASTITIPVGSVESALLTVTRTPGTTVAVTVDMGDPLPGLPTDHSGYTLVKSEDLPLIFNAVSTPSETTLMAIKGTVTTEDGTPAEAGLQVTATIGSTTKTATSEAGGGYSVIFLSTAVVATSGDTATVQVLDPNTGGTTERTVPLSSEQIAAKQATIDLQFSTGTEYLLSVPTGISLIHVPLKVTAVNGAAQTVESIADLYDALGGASSVSLLITLDPQAQQWRGYFGSGDRGASADKVLTDDLGIIAVLIAPTSVQLSGEGLGTNGSSSITLHPGMNLVGVPLKDSRITRVSDLLGLEGMKDNITLAIVSDNGEFKLTESVGDSGDIAVPGGQSFILVAQRAAPVEITGAGWSNSDTAVAPSMALTGIGVTDITPVLAVTGSIGSPVGGASLPRPSDSGFRVTVKNLSTGRVDTAMTDDDGASYRFTFVDTETGRAAQVGDILELSAHSADPLIGVHPVRHTVTVEDVKRSRIELAELVAYEIPAKTELLLNYPNPFNPETWIPYRLAKDAFVTVTIYDPRGRVVRQLNVGHQLAAVYESRSEAIYWDGRTEFGERVASGIYFYTLTAGDYSATRKMVILK